MELLRLLMISFVSFTLGISFTENCGDAAGRQWVKSALNFLEVGVLVIYLLVWIFL